MCCQSGDAEPTNPPGPFGGVIRVVIVLEAFRLSDYLLLKHNESILNVLISLLSCTYREGSNVDEQTQIGGMRAMPREEDPMLWRFPPPIVNARIWTCGDLTCQ